MPPTMSIRDWPRQRTSSPTRAEYGRPPPANPAERQPGLAWAALAAGLDQRSEMREHPKIAIASMNTATKAPAPGDCAMIVR